MFHKPTLDVSGAQADKDERRHLIRGGSEIDRDVERGGEKDRLFT